MMEKFSAQIMHIFSHTQHIRHGRSGGVQNLINLKFCVNVWGYVLLRAHIFLIDW